MPSRYCPKFRETLYLSSYLWPVPFLAPRVTHAWMNGQCAECFHLPKSFSSGPGCLGSAIINPIRKIYYHADLVMFNSTISHTIKLAVEILLWLYWSFLLLVISLSTFHMFICYSHTSVCYSSSIFLVHFSLQLLVFDEQFYWSDSYLLDKSLLMCIWVANIFSHFTSCYFISEWCLLRN